MAAAPPSENPVPSPAVLDPPKARSGPSTLRRPDGERSPGTRAALPAAKEPGSFPAPRAESIAIPVPLVLPPRVTEIDPFLAWVSSDDFPPGLRASLIGGRLYLDLHMDDLFPHNALKTQVARAFGNLAAEVGLGRVFGDGALFAHRPDGTGNEPDAMLVTYETLRLDRVRLLPAAPERTALTVQGAVDLIVECVSPSTVDKDTVRLRAAYFSAGVREYWILDGRGGALTFTLLSRGDDAGDWAEVAADAGGARLSPVLNRRVRIDRITDPAGYPDWVVRLEKSTAE